MLKTFANFPLRTDRPFNHKSTFTPPPKSAKHLKNMNSPRFERSLKASHINLQLLCMANGQSREK